MALLGPLLNRPRSFGFSALIRGLVSAFLSCGALLVATPVEAANPACGASLTVNTTLTSDLDCTGYAGSPALTIAASGITLDGGGHKILMTDAGRNNTAVYAKNQKNITITNLTVDANGGATGTGIQIAEDAAGLSQNCSITNVGASNRVNGILSVCDSQVITNVTATGNTTVNLELGGVGATLSGNTLTGGAIGIYLVNFTGAFATSTTTVANANIGMQAINVGSISTTTTLTATGITFSGNLLQAVAGSSLTNVTLTGVNDVGPNPGYNSSTNDGIFVGGTGISITHSSLQGRGRHCVYVNAGNGANIVIDHVTVSTCGSAGIAVVSSTATTVTNSTASSSYYGFNFGSASGSLVFTGNTSQNNSIGVYFGSSTSLVFDNAAATNLIQHNSYIEIYVYSCTNMTISNWVLNGNNVAASSSSNWLINTGSSSGTTIDTISSPLGGHYFGVYMYGPNSTARHVAVSAVGSSLYINGGLHDVIDSNTLGGGVGLYVDATSDPVDTDVTITNNDFRGATTALGVYSTNHFTFDGTSVKQGGNRFGSNLYAGIFGSSNEHATIKNVDVSGTLASYNGNTNYGVYLAGDYTLIDHVTASGRGTGILTSGGLNVVSNCVANNNIGAGINLANSPRGTDSIAATNTLHSNGIGVEFSSAYGGTATGNDFSSSSVGIYLSGVNGFTYDDAATTNTFTGTFTGIELVSSTGTTIENLTLAGSGLLNGDFGVYVPQSNNNSVTTVSNVHVSKKSNGIYLSGAGNTVANVSATQGTNGLTFFTATGGTVSHAVLSGNAGNGFTLNQSSSGPAVDHMDVSNCAVGVEIYISQNWSFDGHDVNGNDLGDVFTGDTTAIRTDSSSGLVIADFNLSGTNQTGYGLLGWGLSNSTVSNLVVTGRLYGVELLGNGGIGNTTLTGINADNCVNGLWLQSGTGFTITGGTARHDTSGIVFDRASAMAISGIDLTGSLTAITMQDISFGLALDNSTANVTFSGNTTGVYITNSYGVSLSNINLSLASSDPSYRQGYGVSCSSCTQLTLDHINGSGHNYGAFVSMSSFSPVASITNSTFDNFNTAGVELANMSNATLSNVTMRNGNGPGIYFQTYTGALAMSGVSTSGSVQPIFFSSPNSNVLIDGAPVGLPANDFSGGVQNGITGALALGTIQNVDVSGPPSGGLGYGISISGDGLFVTNVTANSRQYGISVAGNNAQIYNSLIHGNSQYGVQITGTNALVNNNRVCFNATDGLYDAAAHTVDATNNFWGTTNGPTVASNVGGTGDAIGGNPTLVAYAPYLTSGSGCVSSLAARQFALSGVVSAAAGTAQTLTVTALDAFGVVASSYSGTVHLRSADAQAVLGADARLTNGVGYFAVTFKTAGSQYVIAEDKVTPQLYSQATVQVSPAAPQSIVLVSGGGQTAAAGTGFPNPFVVQAFDAYGNTVPNMPVAIASSHAGASASPNATVTGGTGQVTSNAIASTVAGSSNFTVTSSAISGFSLNIPATAVPGTPALLTVTGLASPTMVAGSTSTITVASFDRYSNATTSYTGPVQFTSTDPRATLPSASALTNGTGTFPITLRTAGMRSVAVSDLAYPGPSGSQSTTVVSGAAAQLVLVSGSNQTATVGTAASAPIVVEAVDASGNPVSGTSVTFAATTSGASVGSPSTQATSVAGLAQDTATVGTLLGAYTFIATSAGLTGSPVVVQVNAQAGAASKLVYISGGNQRGTVGTALSGALLVSTTDQYGNRVGNQSVTFAPSAAGVGSISPTTVSSDGAGLASAIATLGTVAGAQQFRVSAGFASNVVTYDSTALAGAATQLAYVSGNAQTGVAGSVLAAPLLVAVSDAYANPVQGVSVVFAATTAGASVNPSTVTSDASGQARALATLSSTTGTNNFSASVGGLTGSPVAFSETGTPGSGTRLVLSGVPLSSSAGAVFSVTVTALDVSGNTVTSFSGPVTFSSTDSSAQFPSSPALSHGVATFSLALRTAGTQTLAVADPSHTLASASALVVVSAGAAAHIAIISGDAQSGAPGSTLAQPLRVQVSDAYGNPVEGNAVTFAAPGLSPSRAPRQFRQTSTSTAAVSPATINTDAQGFAQTIATLGATPGAETFTATATGFNSGNPVSFSEEVKPGGATHFSVTGVPSTVTAGSIQQATVTALDASGNVVVDFAGLVTLSSSDSKAKLGADAVLAQGVGTFSVQLMTAGTQSISAASRIDATIVGNENGITVQAGAPSALLLASQGPTSFTCGCRDLALQLRDAAGNIVASPLSNVQLSVGGAAQISATNLSGIQATLPAQSVSGALDGSGAATLTVCDNLVETLQVTASQSTLTSNASQSLTIITGPLDVAQSTLASSTPTLESLDGVAHLTLTPRDACGNPLGARLAGVLLHAASPGVLTPVIDQGDGTYTADLSATSCGGTGTTLAVTAQINNVVLDAQLSLAISCVPVAPEKSSVAVSTTTVVRCDDLSRDQVQITVVPRDAAGQPLGSDAAVTLDTSGAIVAGALTRVGDAFAGTFTASTCGAAPVPVRVLVNGVAISAADLGVTFTCPAIDPSQSALQINKVAIAPDGADSATVTVAGVTSCGEFARDRAVVLSSKLGTLHPPSGTTSVAGTFLSDLTSRKSGTDQISGTIDGVALAPVTIKYELTAARPGGGGCTSSGEPALLALAAGLLLVLRRGRRNGAVRA